MSLTLNMRDKSCHASVVIVFSLIMLPLLGCDKTASDAESTSATAETQASSPKDPTVGASTGEFPEHGERSDIAGLGQAEQRLPAKEHVNEANHDLELVRANVDMILEKLDDVCSGVTIGVIGGSVYRFNSAVELVSNRPVDATIWGRGLAAREVSRQIGSDEVDENRRNVTGILYLMDIIALPGGEIRIVEDGTRQFFGRATANVKVGCAWLAHDVVGRRAMSPDVTFTAISLVVRISGREAILESSQSERSWAITLGDSLSPRAYESVEHAKWLPASADSSPGASRELAKIKKALTIDDDASLAEPRRQLCPRVGATERDRLIAYLMKVVCAEMYVEEKEPNEALQSSPTYIDLANKRKLILGEMLSQVRDSRGKTE